MKTDAELLVAARTDSAAFRELYNRYAVGINGFHQRRCRDAHAALDLTAETFAQAWLTRERFRDEAGGSAGPWLYGIARNVLLMSVRKRAVERAACERLGVLERLGSEPATTDPDETWLEGLDEALADLPADQRQAIELRIVGDLGYDQLADIEGTTPDVARARVSRGLASLRHRLTDSQEISR